MGYVPISPGVAPPSGTVRVSLTDAAHAETIGVLGSQVASVEGEVRARMFERKHMQVGRSLLIAGALVGVAIWVGSQGHGNVSYGRPTGPPGGGK
jgi:hypothetical protein